MVCDLTQRKIKRLLIAAPQNLRALYGASDRDYEGTLVISSTTYDLLRVYPNREGGYVARQINRESKGLRRGFGGHSFTPYQPYVDTEISVTARISAPAFQVLRAVHEISASSGFGGAPSLITVLDYAQPNLADWATGIAGVTEPFTQRLCELDLPEWGQVRGLSTGPWSLEETVSFTLKVVG